MEKAELIAVALQQRIGELVAMYETQIASLRAELTKIMNDQKEKEKAAQSYSDEVAAKIGLENE